MIAAIRFALVFAILLAALAGCVPVPPPSAPSPVAQPTLALPAPAATAALSAAPADPLSVCPPATDMLQRLVAPDARYCLAYPAEYKVERPGPNETILVIGGLLDAEHPRAHIRVTDAAGETAERAADRAEQEFADFTLARSNTTVGGEPAVILDKVPGQEINRRVLFVKDGLLYDIMFAPADPLAEAFAGMNALQQHALGSFTFLPDGLSMENDCLTPTAGNQLHLDLARGFCLLFPPGYSVQQTDASEAVFYSGSLMDVAKPKLFVRVEDANGLTEEEIADALVADAATALPDHKIERSFGVTLNDARAELLDNVPGQDLSRVVIALNGPRAYRLTFVPDDPAQGEVYAEMEALYDLALRSFRFVP